MDTEPTNNLAVRAIKLTSGDPYNRRVEERKLPVSDRREFPKFEVRCHAGDAGHLDVCTDSVSVRVFQRIRREGKEEMWGSLLVECKEQDDGSLAVEVVVCHPEWDESVRIASLQSNSSDANAAEPTLRCDFQQKQL
jgi:hypothetical protein